MITSKRKRRSEFQGNSVVGQEGHSGNGKDSSAWALEIPLILQRIVSHLSVPDILHNCSLVNKTWCYESRTFIRDKRTCTLRTALLKTHKDLRAVETLISSKVIPFNGISVYCPQEYGRGVRVRIEQQILQLIQITKLTRLYIYEDEMELDCDRRMSRNIIEQTLRKKSGTIEEISIIFFTPHNTQLGTFMRGILTSENFSLPVLRTLTFHREQRVSADLLNNCVIPIIAIAPKLKNVFLTLPLLKPVRELVFPVLPPEYVRLLKRVRFTVDLFQREVWNRLLTNTNVECKHLELAFFTRWGELEQQDRLAMLRLLRPFLMQNRNSITFLVTDAETIMVLQQIGLLGLFPRLKHLRIKVEPYGIDPREQERLFPIVSSISHTFPQLESLALEGRIPVAAYIPSEYAIILDPIQTGETQQKGITPQGLKELTLRECYDQAVTEAWAAMLPEIEHLVVSAAPEIAHINLSHIWRCWPSLVSLQVIYHRTDTVNFNSAVCGLSRAEVKMLQKKSAEELEQLMVVPSGPSITGMTHLKQLRVCVVNEKAYWKKTKCPVPKVAQAVAFERMKNLKVEFHYVPKYWLGRVNELRLTRV